MLQSRRCPPPQEEHEGLTCEQYAKSKDTAEVDRLFRSWRQQHDVRDCPKCGAAIEKRDGCNHMECAACRAHICWYCMAVLPGSKECYAHMTEKHGGHTPGLGRVMMGGNYSY